MFSPDVYYKQKSMGENAQFACGSRCPSTQDVAYGGCSYSQDALYGNCAAGNNTFGVCAAESYMPQFWPACDGAGCQDTYEFGPTAPLTRTMYASGGASWRSPKPDSYFPWRGNHDTNDFHTLWNRGQRKQKDLVDVVMPRWPQQTVLPGPGFNIAEEDTSLRGHSRYADACNC